MQTQTRKTTFSWNQAGWHLDLGHPARTVRNKRLLFKPPHLWDFVPVAGAGHPPAKHSAQPWPRRPRGYGGCGAAALPTDLVVEGADVQGGVPRGVLGPHVGPVEEQVLQVLHVSVPAGLKRESTL